MQAKYLEIPVNTQATTGTMDLVINSRASNALSTGTNSNQGNILAISVPGGANSGYNVGVTTGVATTGGTGGNTCFVDIDVNVSNNITAITVTTPGSGYTVSDTLTIVGAGGNNCTFIVNTINNAGFPAQLLDVSAAFTSANVGDVVYDGTSAVSTILAFVSATQLTCNAGIFGDGGETYHLRKPLQLDSTGATFTARKVRVGDRVDNTTAGTNTTVAALISETSLTLLADIFGTAGAFDDNFTITPLATQVYDPTATFLTTVTADDVVDNTTDGVTGSILSVVDDFRITTSSALMFGDGDSYIIFDQSSISFPLMSVAQFVYTDRGADNFTTKIYLNSNNTLDVLNITHSDQGTGRLVSAAIENTLIRGAVGVNLPEPPGPAVARVLMPLFGGSQITVESIVLANA